RVAIFPLCRAPRHALTLFPYTSLFRSVLLYLIPASQALLPIDDPDIWWHLRTGQWIIEHHWVPATDPFSAYGMGKPWVAYGWLLDRKSTRLNSSHVSISYAVFCLKKKR